MEITLNVEVLKEIVFILVGICLVVFVVYGICLLKNLIVTVKHTNKILSDTEVVSGIAADKAQEVDKIIGDVSASVQSVADIIKGNQSIVQALTSIINALGSIKNLLKHN